MHEALLAAGRIADPYFDRNEDAVRWIEERDWWYRTSLPAMPSSPAAGRTLLVCHGLDTVADLWLDGQPLGHSENMFRPATFEVTGRLDEGAELLICFRPPLAGLSPPAAASELLRRLGDAFAAIAPEDGEGAGLMSPMLPLATLRRKATFSWGWDFGPRLPSIGPWRPVEVVQESGAVLTGHSGAQCRLRSSYGFRAHHRRYGYQTTISTFATATWQRSPCAGLSRTSPTTSCEPCPVFPDRSIEGAPREHDQAQRG